MKSNYKFCKLKGSYFIAFTIHFIFSVISSFSMPEKSNSILDLLEIYFENIFCTIFRCFRSLRFVFASRNILNDRILQSKQFSIGKYIYSLSRFLNSFSNSFYNDSLFYELYCCIIFYINKNCIYFYLNIDFINTIFL